MLDLLLLLVSAGRRSRSAEGKRHNFPILLDEAPGAATEGDTLFKQEILADPIELGDDKIALHPVGTMLERLLDFRRKLRIVLGLELFAGLFIQRQRDRAPTPDERHRKTGCEKKSGARNQVLSPRKSYAAPNTAARLRQVVDEVVDDAKPDFNTLRRVVGLRSGRKHDEIGAFSQPPDCDIDPWR